MTFEVMIFISANILEAEILIELSRQISEEKVRGNWIIILSKVCRVRSHRRRRHERASGAKAAF